MLDGKVFIFNRCLIDRLDIQQVKALLELDLQVVGTDGFRTPTRLHQAAVDAV